MNCRLSLLPWVFPTPVKKSEEWHSRQDRRWEGNGCDGPTAPLLTGCQRPAGLQEEEGGTSAAAELRHPSHGAAWQHGEHSSCSSAWQPAALPSTVLPLVPGHPLLLWAGPAATPGCPRFPLLLSTQSAAGPVQCHVLLWGVWGRRPNLLSPRCSQPVPRWRLPASSRGCCGPQQ